MLALLQPVPTLSVEPGDLVHHPHLPGPTRALWVLRTDSCVRVLLQVDPEHAWLTLPVDGTVMVNDRATDNPTGRLLAAVRGGRDLAGTGQVDRATVQLLVDALTEHAGRHPSVRAMVRDSLADDARWVPVRPAI